MDKPTPEQIAAMKAEHAELEKRITEIAATITPLRHRQREIREEHAQSVFGAVAGQIVIYRRKEYRIVETVRVSDFWKPWVVANPRKANGEFGTANRTLYSDWELKP